MNLQQARPWALVALAMLEACRRTGPSSDHGTAADTGTPDALVLAAPRAESSAMIAATTPSSLPNVAPPDRSWISHMKGSRVLGEKHPLGVLTVAFHPDGVHAMSSGVDEIARFWDLRTGEVVKRFTGPRFKFIRIVFTPDGQRALTAGDTASYWEVSTGNVIRELPAAENEMPNGVALSHDEERAVASVPGNLLVWDLKTGAQLRRVSIRGSVLSLRYANGDREIQAVTDGSFCTAEAKGDSPVHCTDFPLLETGPIVAASAPDTQVLLGTRYGQLFLWDNVAKKATKHWAAQGPARSVFGIDYRRELGRAISGGDTVVKFWDVARGVALTQLSPIPQGANAVALSEDASVALVGSEEGTVHLWRLPVPRRELGR